MATKEEALAIVKLLVSHFELQLPSYKKNYSETQTRIDFIDPFFEALGWDFNNKKGFSEAYRDIIHEDKIKIGKATKAPDYSIRFQGNTYYYLSNYTLNQFNHGL